MVSHNLNTGDLGESIAKDFLEKKGCRIIEQNCKNKYGEIDLVALDKETLIFVEVKTRIGERFGSPEDALTRNKIFRLIKNAEAYIVKKGRKDIDYRIDAICIVLDEEKKIKRIEHYENIAV